MDFGKSQKELAEKTNPIKSYQEKTNRGAKLSPPRPE